MVEEPKNPFSIRGENLEDLGTLKPSELEFSAEGYSEGKVDEETIAEVMNVFGDDQVFHDIPYIASILSENSGDQQLLDEVRPTEITAPAASAVYEAIVESDLPVTGVQVECNAPIDTADILEAERIEKGGKSTKKIFRERDQEEPAVEIVLEYGVPSSDEEYTRSINRQNAAEFVGVLGMHPQDGNLIQSAEAEFSMTEGEKNVSRKTSEPVYSADSFDIRPNIYLAEDGDGNQSEIIYNLVETDPEVMGETLARIADRLEQRELEGTVSDNEELKEEVNSLRKFLQEGDYRRSDEELEEAFEDSKSERIRCNAFFNPVLASAYAARASAELTAETGEAYRQLGEEIGETYLKMGRAAMNPFGFSGQRTRAD